MFYYYLHLRKQGNWQRKGNLCVQKSSINEVKALRGRGFCDDSSEALVLKKANGGVNRLGRGKRQLR